MNDNSEMGICRTCLDNVKLTDEHVPPRSANNSHPIKLYNGLDLISNKNDKPWDVNGLRYDNKQKGRTFKSICAKCNNNFGSWYVPYYAEFVNEIYDRIIINPQNQNVTGEFVIKNMCSLAIFKHVITMFMVINSIKIFDDTVYDFISSRESTVFPSDKYRVYMYAFRGGMERFLPVSVMRKEDGILKISEISTIPVGFVLCFNSNRHSSVKGADITFMSESNYDVKHDIKLNMNIYQSHTIIPLDYRAKDEFD
ncbi:MAG: hypothetical protein CVU94_06030 [Firmicutes bacterium HGW-Firmicutes-19]|nr:MAG: hypothetical protein CVU94_06030 [Firmicutes bacterium HGW-Firmicutes-19]